MLEVSILGYPEVKFNQTKLEFAINKTLALLLYLILEPGEHSRDKLAGLFWGEMPDDRAKANLRNALYQLQKLLPDYINATRLTVEFNATLPYVLDVDTLVEASGEFMEGFYVSDAPLFEEWLWQKRSYYRHTRLQYLNQAAQTYEKEGDWAKGVIYLRTILEMDAFDESVLRRMLTALARLGNFEQALIEFKHYREKQLHELGVDVTSETIDLIERIKALRNRSQRHNLPIAPTIFIERPAELAHLTELLALPDVRLISIVGSGGIGKTRLALRSAQATLDRFLDGVVFVNLIEAKDVLSAIVETLILHKFMVATTTDEVLHQLYQREMLIVLDSFETHMQEVDTLIDLLQKGTHLKILVTTRVRLNTPWEHSIWVQGLAHPPKLIDDWEAYAALVLMHERIRQISPDFSFTPDTLADAIEICRLVDGLPLAIELASASTTIKSLRQIALDIQQSIDSLASTQTGIPERHRSIRATLDYTWRLLSDREQEVLAKLAIFPASFSAEAALAIADADIRLMESLVAKSIIQKRIAHIGSLHFSLHDLLRDYLREHTHQADMTRFNAYYLNYLTQRQYALVSHTQPTVCDEIELELDNIHHAIRTSPHLSETVLESIKTFYNIRGRFNDAYVFFSDLEATHKSTRLLIPLKALFALRSGFISEVHVLCEQSIDDPDLVVQASTYEVLARLGFHNGDYAIAQNHLRIALDLYRQINAHYDISPLLNLMGLLVSFDTNRPEKRDIFSPYGNISVEMLEESQMHFQKALDVCIDRGNSYVQSAVLNNMGFIAYSMGFAPRFDDDQKLCFFETAQIYFTQAVELAQTLNAFYTHSQALHWLANTDFRLNNYAMAYQHYKKSLELALHVNNQISIMDILCHIAISLADYGFASPYIGKVFDYVAQHPATDDRMRQWAEYYLEKIEGVSSFDHQMNVATVVYLVLEELAQLTVEVS